MSRFAHIPRRHTGPPRFPQEGDEPVNGPVVEYRLTPEEIAARYGAPTGKSNQGCKLSRENLVKLLRTRTVGQVAEMRRVPQKLVLGLCEKYEIELDEKNRLASEPGKDVDNMPDMTIMDSARKILPPKKLGALLAANKTGAEIAKEYDLPQWAVSNIKKEYWPDGFGFNPGDYPQAPAPVAPEPPRYSIRPTSTG